MGPPTLAATLRPRDQASPDECLRRLEASVSWLQRERMFAALDADLVVTKQAHKLPRARQLPSIPGLRPVGTAHAGGPGAVLDFQPTPPSVSDRFQVPPARARSFELRAALLILLGSIVVGSIAYHLSTGGSISAAAQAQASPFEAR
jgi:hypothetical protein